MYTLGVTYISGLFFKKHGNISLAKSPLLAFLEGRQNVLTRKFVHGVRAHVENHGNLLAVQQLLISLKHKSPPRLMFSCLGGESIFCNMFARDCKGVKRKMRGEKLRGSPESVYE